MNPLNRFLIRKAILLCFLATSAFVCQAQFVIQYPNASQEITVCLNSSLLTVRIDVSAVQTSNDTVVINFPSGISYIPGSIKKTGGTAALDIADAGGTPESPKFVITPVTLTAGQNITFTIERHAISAARTYALEGGIFKDEVNVKGTAGFTIESNPTVNPYNVNYPSISISQPASVNNTIPGGIYSRNFIITNGSDGCADAVHFYIVYPNSGLELQSLSLGENMIIPASVHGDTLLFDISGALLTADSLFCNGENLVFTEIFKVKQCNAASSLYSAGWGCSTKPSEWCQTSSGEGSISSANGVPVFSAIARENIGFVDKCTPFDYSLTLTNGGSGNINAATMYDIAILQGQHGQSKTLVAMDMSLFNLSNVRVGTASVAYTLIDGILTLNLKDLFTSDPDGEGGMADVDGDGYYDDLPGGQSVKYTVTLKFNCSIECNTSKSLWGLSATLKYHTMCDTAIVTADRLNASMPLPGNPDIIEDQFVGAAYVPANIQNAVPFRIALKAGNYTNRSYYDGLNTRYRWKVVLPPGIIVSGSGNPTYGDLPVSYTQVGDTIIYVSANNSLSIFNIDLVYDCLSGGGVKIFYYTLEKIQDITTSCKCQGDLICATVSTLASCQNICAVGPNTYIPKVSRTVGSLGWTDATLTTRQNPAAINAYDLSKALYLDTIQISGYARQNNPANNLHLELQLGKTTLQPSGIDKLTPLTATINIYRDGVLLSMGSLNVASQTGSTAAMQQIDWDITPLLPMGGLLAGDSIQTLTKYLVSTNDGLPLSDTQSGNRWAFYNLNIESGKDECNYVVPEMYLVGTVLGNGANSLEFSGCNFNILEAPAYYIGRRFNTAGALFQNEYRPAIFIDSFVLDLPDGYEFISASFRSAIDPALVPMVPSGISGHIYTFVNPGTWKNLPLTIANNFGGFFSIKVRPTCTTLPTENVNVKTFIKDFYYAYAGRPSLPGTSLILEGPDGKTKPILYSTKSQPDILISDQTGLIQAAAPIESWVARLSSIGATIAPYTWLGIPQKTGVNVVQVIDLASNTILTPISYPEGIFYKLSSTGIPSGTNADYRISFTYTSSTKDSLRIIAGWNCSEFPSDPSSYSCGVDSLWLKFTPVISEVGIIPISVPESTIDLCVPAKYEYSVNCSQAGNTVDNTVSVKLPLGLNLIAGSFEAEYPVGANNWTALSPNVSGNIYTYNLSELPAYPTTTGLPGTLNASNVNDRQIGVRFQTTTYCDFVANTNFILSTAASQPSGIAAIGSSKSFQGPTIIVSGVSLPYSTVNSLSSSNIINCSNTATVSVNSIIVAGKTGVSGTLKMELPAGIELVPASFTCSSAFCPTFIGSTLQSDNKTLLLFAIPSGIEAGNALQFSIDVRDNNSASCDLNTIYLQAEDVVSGIACPTVPGGVCASLGVVTGNGNTTLTIVRPILSFASLSGNVSSMSTGISDTYNVDLKVINSGSANLEVTNPLSIDFYCADSAGNPIGDVLSTFTNAVTILIGDTYSANYSFKANGCKPANDFVAVITQNSNCICSQAMRVFHANIIPVANADNNTTSEDTPFFFNITDNDIDIDGTIASGTVDLDPATDGLQTMFTVVGEGAYTVNASGVVTFTPELNFNGSTTPLNYTVQDNNGATSNIALVSITVNAVNDLPTAIDDAFSVFEDTPVSGNVSINDTPSSEGGNIWSLVGINGGASHGAVTMINDGSFTFTPATNFFGTDTFTYIVCDVDGDCSTAKVIITVDPVNDAPVAVADKFVVKENHKLEGKVIVNDYDVDGDQLTLDITPQQTTAHGMLVLLPNGDFTYQPVIDFRGIDAFTYRICDNGTPSLCATAIVTIEVLKDENCKVFVPNSFSPNGDGIHDLFKIRCLYNYDNPVIEIYNRWGNLVFKKDHYGNVDFWGSETDAWWNGRSDHKLTIGNEQLSVGTYYYVLKLNNTKALTGFLFLNK